MKRAFIVLAVVTVLWWAGRTSSTAPAVAEAPSSPTTAASSAAKSDSAVNPASERPTVGVQTPSDATLSLTIIDEKSEQPLEGVAVDVHQGPRERGLIAASARTDSTGSVTLRDLRFGSWNVSLRRDGYDDRLDLRLHLPVDERLTMIPLRRLKGRVLLPDGSPAADAGVGFDPRHATRTGVDGSFHLGVPEPSRDGPVHPPNTICASSGPLSASARLDDLSEPLRLHNGAPGALLRVFDEDGRPLSEVRVIHARFASEPIAVTDLNGEATIPDLCGESRYVNLERDAYVPRQATIPMTDGHFVMQRSGPVRGVVVDDHGLGIPGALVMVDRTGGEATLTDERGRFTLSAVAASDRIVATEGDRTNWRRCSPDATTELTINIGAPAAQVAVEVIVDGKVSDAPWHLSTRQLDGPYSIETSWMSANSRRWPATLSLPTGAFRIEATRAPGFDQRTGSGQTEVRVDASAPPAVLQIYATEKPQ